MLKSIKESYLTSLNILTSFVEDESNFLKTAVIAKHMADVFRSGGKVIICGNGGSATDAMHFAEEFTGRFRKDRKALPAIALSDPSHITCVGNDYGFEDVFSRGVEAYAKAGDMVVGLSTSGSSTNVIKALEKAKELGCSTFSLLGKDGGELKNMCNYEIIIPGKTSDRIQEMHMMILHIIIESVERDLFPENY